MKVGEVVAGLVVSVMFLAALGAFAEIEWLAWAHRGSGFLVERGLPAPGYVVGVVLLGVSLGFGGRALLPRARDVGLATKRRFLRTLRREQGIWGLYVRRGMRAALVVALLLWVGVAGIVLFNLAHMADTTWEAESGIYLAGALVPVGFLGTLLIWPTRSNETVLMDRQGNIHRPDRTT